MEKQTRNMEALKKKYAILKGQGFNQKEIAKQLNVSEATISAWRKNLPISHFIIIRDGYIKRLEAMSNEVDTLALDIYNLTNSLVAIQKLIDKHTGL